MDNSSSKIVSSAINAKKRNHVFDAFRAIGYVCDDVPLSIQARGGKYFFTSSIGRAFQVWNVRFFGLEESENHTC
jgi:U3 small nucleolar RNA-associated protein 21